MDSSPAVAAAYEAALPADPRIERKQMFGSPCAFVNRQMFFGCFADSIVARVGPNRAEALVGQPGVQAFTPTEGRTWSDYVQVPYPADPALLTRLAADALAWTDRLPAKVKKPRAKKEK